MKAVFVHTGVIVGIPFFRQACGKIEEFRR